MSLVRGRKTVKNFDDFKNTVNKILKKLDKIGILIPDPHGYHPSWQWNRWEGSYHIEDSTVYFYGGVSCLEEEHKRNYDGSNMGASFVVVGKDHENVREQLSDVLKQSGIEDIRVGNITKDDSYRLFYKLIEQGILKKEKLIKK